jgi:hypothetical protein
VIQLAAVETCGTIVTEAVHRTALAIAIIKKMDD